MDDTNERNMREKKRRKKQKKNSICVKIVYIIKSATFIINVFFLRLHLKPFILAKTE